jgi:hypothetical protein
MPRQNVLASRAFAVIVAPAPRIANAAVRGKKRSRNNMHPSPTNKIFPFYKRGIEGDFKPCA